MKTNNPHSAALKERASIIEATIKDMKKVDKEFSQYRKEKLSFLEIEDALVKMQRELEKSDVNEHYTKTMHNKVA